MVDGYKCVFVCVYSPYTVVLIFSHNGGTRIKKKSCMQTHVSWHGCVCFPDLLAFHVETHTFLYKHMCVIFIAPALTSPWQPMPGGGI